MDQIPPKSKLSRALESIFARALRAGRKQRMARSGIEHAIEFFIPKPHWSIQERCAGDKKKAAGAFL
ncbi:MAG: hypothetical protein DMG80_03910 [Acidobacteria bacterium]|nr:MAG: hypothetical protein DMG80_03910 [Acidobacteriota bacterium]